MNYSLADVVARVGEAAFGKPLVTNVIRGLVVEAIVAMALEPEWRWCSADYASWDFDRADGTRLEVKQSAARQSWPSKIDAASQPRFDVRSRTGYWQDECWVATPGRAAQLYLFCHHDRIDDAADHRVPFQWSFYIVPAMLLPDVKTVGLSTIRHHASPASIGMLRAAIDATIKVSRCPPSAPGLSPR